MNEQQIQRAFQLFQDRGYTGDINHFRGLVTNNQDAANDARNLLAQDSPVEKKSLFESPIIDQEQEPPVRGGVSKPAAGSSASQGTSVFAKPLVQQPQQVAGPLTEETAQEPVKPKPPVQLPTGRQIAMENVAPAEKQPIPVQTIVENKPEFVSPEFKKSSFNKSLNQAIPDIFTTGSRGTKEKLDYYFSDYGFNFEQDGGTIKITAPNGNTTEIDIDKANTPQLKRFIALNAPADKDLITVEKEYNRYSKKFYTENDKKNAINQFADEQSLYKKEFESYMFEKNSLDLLTKKINEAPESIKNTQQFQDGLIKYRERMNALQAKREGLVKLQEKYSEKEGAFHKNLGDYIEMKSEQGSTLSAVVVAMNQTLGEVAKGLVLTADFIDKPYSYIREKLGVMNTKTRSDITKKAISAIDEYIKGVEEGSGVTPERMAKIEEGTISGPLFGIAKIAPLLVASAVNPAIGAATWYNQGVGSIRKEIDESTDLKDLSDEEKYLVSMPFGIVAAAIGEIGGAYKAGNEAVIKSIANEVLATSGKDVTVNTFKELVENNIKSKIAKGALIIAKDGAAHFATGATLYGLETGVKGAYNLVKDKEMFKMPSVDDFVDNLVKSGTSMMIGGLMMDAPKIMSESYKASNYNGVTDETLDLVKNFSDDPDVRKAITSDLTSKIMKGELTPDEAKAQRDLYDKSAALLKSLPDDFTNSQRRKALGILQEKTVLENAIKGKDPATIKDKQARIDEINKQLEEISKTKEDAIQEQTTDEGVLRQEGPQMELQQMGEGNQKPEITAEDKVRKKEIEDLLAQEDNGKGTVSTPEGKLLERTELQKELDGINEREAATKPIGEPVSEAPAKQEGQMPETGVPEGAAPTSEPATEAAAPVPVKETFEQRATRLAERIRQSELPTWLEGIKPDEGATIATKGVSVRDIKMKVADAVVEIGKLMDKGVAMADAVKQYVDDLVNVYGEPNRRRIEDEMLREMSKINDVTRLEGYEDMMKTVEGTVENLRKQGLADDVIMENVMTELTKSEAYKNASDIQMEDIVRDVREKFGLKEKKAPTAEKITGAKAEEKKVTITEKSGLKNQIKSLARGAKDALAAVKEVTDYVSGVVKDAQGKGRVGVRQAAAIAKRVAKTNMLNSKQVSRLVDYIEKTFADADYADKILEASGLRKAVKKLSKSEKVDAFTKTVAREFSKIDPRMISDLATYKETAEALRSALKGSSVTKGEVSIARSANLEKVTEFVEAAKSEQMEKMMAEARETIDDMFGIDAKDMTYDEMMEMIRGNSEKPVVDEAKIKEDINTEFENGKSELDHILKNGTDIEGTMDYDLSKSDRKMLEEFSRMNTENMSQKDALRAIDALNNFIENGTKARMRDILATYKGKEGAIVAKAANLIGRAPKFFLNSRLGKFMGEQLFNKPLLIENMFRGFYNASKIEKLMGFAETSTGKNTALSIHKNAVNDYVKEFYKLKANSKRFNTESNIVERGMYAFMTRTVAGTPEQQRVEFNRRKGLIEQSIKWLSEGTDREKKMAEVYQEVYDKILDGSEDRVDVLQKTDAVNVDAVEFWVNKWAENRDIMSDISEGVYNTILESDYGYTPDRFAKFEEGFTPDIVDKMGSAFFGNSGIALAKSRSGSLMEATRPDKLPTNEKTGEAARYINLSFDNVNSKAFRDAMIDVHTAEGIRQMDAFINSPKLKDIIPDGDARKMFVDLIENYSKEVKDVSSKDYDQFDAMSKSLDKIAKVGSAAALASIAAPLKQTLPVVVNTFINSGSLPNIIKLYYNKDIQKFINESGYAIANRGLETMSNISSLDRSLKAAEEGVVNNVAKAPLKLVEGASEAMLKNLVGKPDVMIARASWITYYEQYIKNHPDGPEKGEVKNIDYSNPETINKDAADYAQKMVDRQQNISDKDMQGKLFGSRESGMRFISKALFSFSTFRINQLMRLHTDMTVLASKTASAEDRVIAAKSIAGFGAEMAAFRATSYFTAQLIHNGIMQMFGHEETDEEKERFLKGLRMNAKTGTVGDLINPIPILDPYISNAINKFYYEPKYDKQLIDKADQELLYGETKQEFTKFLGSIGIPFEKAIKMYDFVSLANTGEYEDKFGNKKQISQEDQDLLKSLKPLAWANMLGILPVEMQTTVNAAVKLAKRKKEEEKEPSKSFLKKYYPEEYKRKYPFDKQKKEKEEPKFITDKKKKDNRFITTKKGRGGKFLGD